MSLGRCEVCGAEMHPMPWFYMRHWFCDKHDASKPWLLEFKSKSQPS